MPTTATPLKTQRISALDFTKGTLVLLMVLYHWLNYFIGIQWGYYQYLRFLTPSFIFITGFMVSRVYLAKYDPTDGRLSLRLFTRGLKLLAIFIVLNVARIVVIPILSTGVLERNLFDPDNLFIIFLSGNLWGLSGKLVSFSILVPISYLLMFSGALMFPYRLYRYTFHVVCGLLLLSLLMMGLFGEQSQNLEFIAMGMLGVLTGFAPIKAINDFVRHPYALAVAYLGYTIAITIWNVPFPLQVVGVPLTLAIIYLVGLSTSESGAVWTEVLLLGKYSLFGYISQIAILQILSASLRHIGSRVAVLCISFIAAFILTLLSAEILDRARTRMASVDKLYKAVFA